MHFAPFAPGDKRVSSSDFQESIGIMEKKMEAGIMMGYILGLYRDIIGIMDKKMEATII